MAVTFPNDTRARQKLEAARDYVKSKEWAQAARVLQDLLDAKEDLFLPKNEPPAPGKAAVYSRSLRDETHRLFLDLPPKALETYNAVHGPKARSLLKEAVERDDVPMLFQVAQRYLFTDAGGEAVERLGTLYLDRGERGLAARCFVHLLGQPDAGRLPPLTLYRAAVACRLTGDAAHEDQAWKALAARAPDGITIGGRLVELDRLRADLARLPAEPAGRGDWPLYRAGAARTGRGDGDVPLLEPAWKVSTVLSREGPAWLDEAARAQERANRLVLPGFYPIAVPGRIVYRSHGGLHALDPASGRELWHVPSPLSLDAIAGDSGKRVTVRNNWLAQGTYGGDAFHFPIENSALGCLSTDGARVYAVEDLAMPPPPEVTMPAQFGLPPPGGPIVLTRALPGNRLWARDLDTGAPAWELGGRGDFQNSFFLGAPLPDGGRLYALVERDGEIRLVCLDAPSGAIAWTQRLGTTANRLLPDPGRRLRGVQMTCADGLLVCPTDAGAVFAFDLFSRSLLWAHLYPSKKQPQETGVVFNVTAFNTSWRESAPAVADGKVVFTPGDSDQVHCVDLRDGKPLWQAGQDGYAYLAGVFRGKVVLVGAGGVRALSLKDGRQAWARSLGVPSGQGAASGGVYYLPLKKSNETGGPGVAAIDADSGKLLAFARSRGGEVPGNLTFFQGQIISQTATSLTAYPQLKARLRHIEELLAGDPRNPRGLMERGTLRLDQGDLPGALADLRAAVAGSAPGQPQLEAHALLHEALKHAVRHDFAAGEKYLAEFEASCRVPGPGGATADERARLDVEGQRREANYLLVLARGREGQGRVAEALAAYAKLYARADRVLGLWGGDEVGWLPLGKAAPPLGRVAASPGPAAWVHGRVSALVINTGPKDRAAVEKEVARQWKDVPAGADLEEVGRFVSLFGAAGTVGLEARLAYAERLAAQQPRGRFLEAELHLLALARQREAPQLAARGLEALARLLTEVGQAEDALYYYRQLAEEFGATPVRDGKKGADFLKELALDRRFLPLLDDPWAGRKYKAVEVRGLFPAPGSVIGMEAEGEAPPCLRRQRLAFDTYGGKLKLFDRNTGAELWSQSVSVGNLRQVLRAAPPQAWIPYRAEGHLAVVTLGHLACGIDLFERRLLWAKDLGEKPTPLVQQVVIDDALGRLKVQYQDGLVQPLGRMAPIRPAGVCVAVRGRLAAFDPLRGDVLWGAAPGPRGVAAVRGADGPGPGMGGGMAPPGAGMGGMAPPGAGMVGGMGGMGPPGGMLGGMGGMAPPGADYLLTTAPLDPAMDLFADEDYVYVVEGQAQGAPAVQRALSLHGGVPRAVSTRRLQPPDALQVVGRNVLLSHTYPAHAGRLALYDALAGKEVWSQPLAAGALVARSEVPHLTATVARDGKVHVYDLRRREELFKAEVDPDHLRGVHEVRLVQDRWHYYLLLNRELRARDAVAGPATPNAVGGLRCVPAHGYLYAFHRGRGSLHWYTEVKTQQLLLERIDESPLLLFSAAVQRADPRSPGPVFTVTSIDKYTGKPAWAPKDYTPITSQVHRVEINPATGTIDLISRNWKLRHAVAE
jgi:outer membrane protein assembly factor BamB